MARYLVGLLNARTPSFFDAHEPVTFSALASPHLGIPRYSEWWATRSHTRNGNAHPPPPTPSVAPDTFISQALSWLGGRLLSRTGEQIYVVDSYSELDERPLLEIMADPSEWRFRISSSRVWH